MVTPMISAASHQVIFLAIAFNNTSCSFIIRSVSAAEYCRMVFNHQLPPPLSQADISRVNLTGQITY